MEYGLHPSEELVELFRSRPFQGQHPEKAKVLFVGIDANYSELLSNHSFFSRILEYQRDSLEFWTKYGRHHPFILDDYRFNKTKDGVPYHRNFSKLGLEKEFAKYISFVELLDVPTVGNSNESGFWKLFNPKHADWLDSIIASDSRKIVLVSNDVVKKMRKIKAKWGYFSWLPLEDGNDLLCSAGKSKVYKIPHFSSYGIHAQIDNIRELVTRFCVDL